MSYNFSARELSKLLNAALQRLWKNDADLLTRGVREDALVSQLVHYITDCVHSSKGDSAVDFNYNLHINDPKYLNGVAVIPDIVLHHRGSDVSNLCVIEVKRWTKVNSGNWLDDWVKIRDFVASDADAYHYKYGISLVINQDEALAFWFSRQDEKGFALKFSKDKEPYGEGRCNERGECVQDTLEHFAEFEELLSKQVPRGIRVPKASVPSCMRANIEQTWAITKDGDECIIHAQNLFSREKRPPERRRTCMLMVTHKCNLNCVYCYEKFKDNQMMDFETAKRAILTEAAYVRAHTDEFDEMEIDFMGGEPMMNMPLIKQVVEWLETEDPLQGLPHICFATTNGTLIHEHKKWLKAHAHTFCLGVSYDGQSSQAGNRGELAKTAPLRFCHTLWPYQGFHMTISKESVKTFGDDVIAFHKKYRGYHLNVAIAQGVEWDDADAQCYYEQLKRVGEYYCTSTSKQIVPINLLTRDLSVLTATQENNQQQKKFCGSGTGMITYDIDGRTYGCHMFTPIVMGEAKAQELRNSEATCEGMVLEDPECVTCFLKHYCPTCLGFNYHFRGDIRTRDKHQCNMFLAELKATCEFQITYFAKHPLLCDADASRLKGAIDVYPRIKDLSLNIPYPFSLTH